MSFDTISLAEWADLCDVPVLPEDIGDARYQDWRLYGDPDDEGRAAQWAAEHGWKAWTTLNGCVLRFNGKGLMRPLRGDGLFGIVPDLCREYKLRVMHVEAVVQ